MKDIDVLCVGEALVDFLPTKRGKLEHVETFQRAVGGAPANVAVGLARLSARVGFVGVVGDDPFGRALVESLGQEGIDTSGIWLTRAARTGINFISLTEAGERSFLSYRDPAADMLLALDHVEGALSLFRRARVVHVGSTSLSKDPARSATRRAVAVAKEQGCLLSCDPNLRLHLWDDKEEAIRISRDLIRAADIVKLSDEEAEILYETRDPAEAARRVLADGPRLVSITLGERGAYLAGPGFSEHHPAFPVQVVDTTGAGDGYCAGFLSVVAPALRAGAALTTLSAELLSEALVRANQVGARVVATLGATPGLPRLEGLGGAG